MRFLATLALAISPSAAAWASPSAAALTSRHGGTIARVGGANGGDGGGGPGMWPGRGGGSALRSATSMISLPRGGAFGIGRGRARAGMGSSGKTSGSSSSSSGSNTVAAAAAIPAGGGDAGTPVGIWPCGDALDKKIGLLAIPAILNFMVMTATPLPPHCHPDLPAN